MPLIRILICDDHVVVRAGLRLMLEDDHNVEIVGEAASGLEALTETNRLRPDIVIMDLSMPGMGGLEALPRLRQMVPETRVLVYTMHDDVTYFFHALEAGAAGYVLKGAPATELSAAVKIVMEGGVATPRTLGPHLLNDYLERLKDGSIGDPAKLSRREREIVLLIASGLTNKQIAEQLSSSVRTVERHRASVMKKLNLQNRAELVSFAVRRGILPEPRLQVSPPD